eukprot:s7226_g1.t1
MIAEDEVKEDMVENDDVEKKKNDEVESDNVESDDELDDNFAKGNEEDDDDVAKDKVEDDDVEDEDVKGEEDNDVESDDVEEREDYHVAKPDPSTCTDDRFRRDDVEEKKRIMLRSRTLRRAQTTDFDVHRRPFLTCTDDPRTTRSFHPAILTSWSQLDTLTLTVFFKISKAPICIGRFLN